ncbi:MAG: hypothetical protein KDC12_08695 [Flavobacteriales bacterium]|nr:hypothetical protein [Flavobacteriales bacterium]
MNRIVFVFGVFAFLGMQQVAQGQMLNSTDNDLRIPWLQDEDEWDEEDESGFSITLNLGAYFASKKSAKVYNGEGYLQLVNTNGYDAWTIAERLDPNIFQANVQSILNATGASGLLVPYDSSPQNMSYQPAFVIGLNLKYNFNFTSGIVFDLNTTRLKAVDQYTIQFIGTTQQQNGQNDTRLYTITGEEQRMFFSLGYRHSWELKGNGRIYLDMFGDALLTQLRSNYIQVPAGSSGTNSTGFATLQLVDYSRATNTIAPGTYNPKAGLGFGFGVGPGVEVYLKDRIRMDIGLIVSRDKVKIENFEGNMINTQIIARFGI